MSVLHCNFHTSKLKICLPEHYKECFDAWSDLNGKRHVVIEELSMSLSGIINFSVTTKRQCTLRKDIINLGFLKIGDVIKSYNSYPVVNPEQRFQFSNEYNQFNSCRMAFCSESYH